MFMRRMRDSAKYVMLVLALAFVGWLVFEGINDMRGGNVGGEVNPVVGVVAGRDIRYTQWNQFLTNELAVARQGNRALTDEEQRIARERAWETLVSSTLLQAELDRLGIRVSDAEIQQAFLTQPPQEMLSHPGFQTDGQFDIEKYRRFFTDPATDEATLLQLESYYRSLLPRAKLEALVESGIYVSDQEAWEFYRDTNETARVRFVRVDPAEAVPDSAIDISDAEIRAYYEEHAEDFTRPAQARVNMVSVPLRPTAEDTAAARARAVELRERVTTEEEDFAEVATAESGDPNSAADGGFMGRRARSDLDPVLAEAAFSLPVGRVSEPLETSFGFHLIQVDERSADSVSLRQIFVPVEVSFETEERAFDLQDELEEIALRTDLVTAADSVGLPVTTDLALTDGVDFVP
ncbi:MAG: SurA N-terminal domain-containing protein, partial [Gemmatimonadota bacterium]|nr:SurA N-terminal domain-containing protein [Gemmatimonadota bacterium]